MNILPHKSWHVRTKKNIAKVRKDEAKAAEEEKEIQRRISLAAQEDRTRFLRERASKRVHTDSDSTPAEEALLPRAETEANLTQPNGHINFFQDIEDGTTLDGAANKEHEEEKKKEQEDYEKKIGYLVYLGQNSLEHSKDTPWYERIARGRNATKLADNVAATSSKATTSSQEDQQLSDLKLEKLKEFQDPLKDIRKYLSTPGVKNSQRHQNQKTSQNLSKPVEAKPEHGKVINTESSPPEKIKKHKKEKKHKKHKTEKHSHRHKKTKKPRDSKPTSSDSDDIESDDSAELRKKQNLEKLRAERLERERQERRKADQLFEKLNPTKVTDNNSVSDVHSERGNPKEKRLFPIAIAKQKYNSQFNPHLARQNFDN